MLSLEHDPAKCEAWRRNVADAGLEEWAELVEGDAFETLGALDDVFDVVFAYPDVKRWTTSKPMAMSFVCWSPSRCSLPNRVASRMRRSWPATSSAGGGGPG